MRTSASNSGRGLKISLAICSPSNNRSWRDEVTSPRPKYNYRVFLERFRHAKAGAPVDKALLIRDADNQNANDLIRQMRDSSHNREYPFPVEPLVVVQTL